jgi:hypothetical protein
MNQWFLSLCDRLRSSVWWQRSIAYAPVLAGLLPLAVVLFALPGEGESFEIVKLCFFGFCILPVSLLFFLRQPGAAPSGLRLLWLGILGISLVWGALRAADTDAFVVAMMHFGVLLSAYGVFRRTLDRDLVRRWLLPVSALLLLIQSGYGMMQYVGFDFLDAINPLYNRLHPPLTGFSGNPNFHATVLGTLLLVILPLRPHTQCVRLLKGASAAGGILSLILLRSFAALIVFGVLCVFLFILQWHQGSKSNGSVRSKRTLFVFAVVAGVAAVAVLGGDFTQLLQRKVEGRVYLTSRALEAIASVHALPGGLGQYFTVFPVIQAQTIAQHPEELRFYTNLQHAHQDLLELAFELGLAGVAALLLLVVPIYRRAFRSIRSGQQGDPDRDIVLSGALASVFIIGVSFSCFPLRLAHTGALCVASLALMDVFTQPFRPSPVRPDSRVQRVAFAGVIVLIHILLGVLLVTQFLNEKKFARGLIALSSDVPASATDDLDFSHSWFARPVMWEYAAALGRYGIDDAAGAEDLLLRLDARIPNHNVKLLLGNIAYRHEDHPGARVWFRAAAELAPASLQIRNNLALSELACGYLQESFVQWSRLLKQSPRYFHARHNLELLSEYGADEGMDEVTPLYAALPRAFPVSPGLAEDALREAGRYASFDCSIGGQDSAGMPYAYGKSDSPDDALRKARLGQLPGVGFGVDCSGLVLNAFRAAVESQGGIFCVTGRSQRDHMTITLDVNASDLYHLNCHPIDADSAVPGDLVFFTPIGKGDSISHTAIVVRRAEGGLDIVDASEIVGRVRVRPLSSIAAIESRYRLQYGRLMLRVMR